MPPAFPPHPHAHYPTSLGYSGQSQPSTRGSQGAPGRMRWGRSMSRGLGRGWAGASLPAVLLAFPSIRRDKRGVSVHHRRFMATRMTPPRADNGAWETKKLLAQGWWSVLEESAAGGQSVCDKPHRAGRSQPGLTDSFATATPAVTMEP